MQRLPTFSAIPQMGDRRAKKRCLEWDDRLRRRHKLFQLSIKLLTMRKLITIVVAIFLTLDVYAGPASQESVEALLEVTKAEALMGSMYGSMEQMMRQGMQQAVKGKTLSSEQQRILDTVPAKFIAVVREELNWEKLKPMHVQLYRDTFEQEEIDGLLSFYRSPAGQAFVNKMPLVMQKAMAMGQSQMQAVIPKMMAAIQSAIAEAKVSN